MSLQIYEMYLLLAATILTTIVVVVEDDCRSTVARTPIIRPATGLDKSLFSENTDPAAFPVICVNII